MILNLILIILIALIIIFSIILYNGLRIILTVEKEKAEVRYKFKITLLKIPIFTKDSSEDKATESEEEYEEEDEYEEESKDKKGLMEKYNEIKPILKELIKSKKELKKYLKDLLKSIDIKKLEGHLIIGLSDSFTTVKIASWIWSIGTIVNSKKPVSLTVEPRFTEIITDFEGQLELKINLLKILFYSLILVSKKDIIELIKVVFAYKKARDKEKEEKENTEEELDKKEKDSEIKENTKEELDKKEANK